MSFNNQYDENVSMGEWLGSMFLTLIPIVGIILVFVWAFGNSTKPSKRNYFRAYLLFSVIIGVISIGVTIAFSSVFITALGGLPALTGFYS